MAEIVISGVVQKLADIAGNLIIKEGSQLAQLKEDIHWIENEMRYMQSYLEDVDAKQWEVKGVLNNFVRNIWDLAYDTEDLINNYFPKLALCGRIGWRTRLAWLKRLKVARELAVEIEEIKKRVEYIRNARQTYGITERIAWNGGDTWDPRRTFPHIDDVNIVGFDDHIENLVAKVVDKDVQHGVVSIVGMAGLGKTTLAKKVYNLVRQKFQCWAWIYVSQQPNMKELLREIARHVGLRVEKYKENLEADLFEFLRQKRYVIVVDDIWHTEHWNALETAIPNNFDEGSRIIITSRNKNLAVSVGIWAGGHNFIHEIQPLDHENSRTLFFHLVAARSRRNEVSSNDLFENIGEQILKRCGGVPLAIAVTAGLLLSRERTKEAWKGVLESMGQNEDQYSNIFALSYRDLPCKLKPCFLYFGLFPEDYEISAFDLVNLWAAEGFIKGSRLRDVEEVGEDYLNNLIARNLIQVVKRRYNGKVKRCRIHDILHNLCIQMAREINFFNIFDDTTMDKSTSNVRRLSTHRSALSNYISCSNDQSPKLRSLLSFPLKDDGTGIKSLKNSIRGSRVLRVLSLNSEFVDLVLQIPNEIGNLRHLTYLQLACSGAIPYSISNLKCLQTLNLSACNGILVPKVIWSMDQLRHIMLPYSCCAPNSESCGVNLDGFDTKTRLSLPNLQTLHVPTKSNIFKADWLHKFSKLRTLKLCGLTEVLEDVVPLSNTLEELRLVYTERRSWNLSRFQNLSKLLVCCDTMEELPHYDKFPPNLTNLTLWYTPLKKDPMETLKKLPKLKKLKLYNFSYTGSKMFCSGEAGNFPQLQVLKLNALHGLEEFVVEEEGMLMLKAFTIKWSQPAIIVPDRIRRIMETSA